MIMTQAKPAHRFATSKAGKSRSLHSPEGGLRESHRKRHYKDTTHNYGNFFECKKRG